MNYWRGFRRVYFLVAVLYISAIAWISFRHRPVAIPIVYTDADIDRFDRGLPIHVASEPVPLPTYWSRAIALALVPPLLCYAIAFLALPWILRGFRESPSTQV